MKIFDNEMISQLHLNRSTNFESVVQLTVVMSTNEQLDGQTDMTDSISSITDAEGNYIDIKCWKH